MVDDGVPISSPLGGFIGTLRSDGVLVIVRNAKEHVYRKLNGISMSTDVLVKLANGGLAYKCKVSCNKIRMTLEGEIGDEILETTPAFWIENGEVIDYGETQTCLPLRLWTKVSTPEAVVPVAVEDENAIVFPAFSSVANSSPANIGEAEAGAVLEPSHSPSPYDSLLKELKIRKLRWKNE